MEAQEVLLVTELQTETVHRGKAREMSLDQTGNQAPLENSENQMENYTLAAVAEICSMAEKVKEEKEAEETQERMVKQIQAVAAARMLLAAPASSLSEIRGRWRKWKKQWRLFQTALSPT